MQTSSPYLSAQALGIEPWEREKLIALIGPLSRGELAFDMRNPKYHCGSACCIGGWVDAVTGDMDSMTRASNTNNHPLRKLYFPQFSGTFARNPFDATGPEGAKAIVNFLTLRDPCWQQIMAQPAEAPQ